MRLGGTACGWLLAGLWAAAGLAEDGEPKVEVGGVLDARLARTDDTLGWLDGGLGKTRYGSRAGERADLATLAQASLLVKANLSEVLAAQVHLNLDAEPEAAGRRGRVGVVEAFAGYRPELTPHLRLKARLGLFFPPVSLEHTGQAWTTVHTITPSAINAWIGEEVRAAGGELTATVSAGGHEVSVLGAAFGSNDPAGTLLAWRGFSLHDRQTAVGDELPRPPNPAFDTGGFFGRQAPWISPLREIDGRIGWYAGASWRKSGRFEARGLYWDNRGRPDVFDGFQYAWGTDFTSLGLRLQLPAKIELLGQHMVGGTLMGLMPDGVTMASAGFEASFGLITAAVGRNRLSVRYDRFHVDDRDPFQALDDNDEDGHAWTAAYSFQTGEHHRIALEWLRVESDRPWRARVGLPAHAEEDLLQASFRIHF